MQVFETHNGGETFVHSDNLSGSTMVKRSDSVLFYLNDDYDGGCVDFPYINTRIMPSKGMMIYFPIVNKYGQQAEDFAHSAGVITRGYKRMCYLTLK